MPFRWIVSPEVAWPALATAYVAAIRAGVLSIANRYAPEIETWMKQNAIWTDRTGNARQALYSEVIEFVEIISIEMAYRADLEYGIWLELANAGRFAIIGPALDYFAPRVWADVQSMLSR